MVSKLGGDLSGPTEDNAASVFWNPAAIGPIEGASLFIDGNFIWRSMEFKRSWLEGFDPGARPSNARMQVLYLQPLLAGTIRPTLDWLTLGLGAYVPFGHRSDWPAWDLEQERTKPLEEQAAPPQAYHTLEGGITALYTTPAVSFRVLEGWWLGAGLSWVYAMVDSTRARDFSTDLSEALGVELPVEQIPYTGLARMDFSGHGFAWSLGALGKPWPWLRIGVSFTSGTHLDLPGRVKLSLPPMLQTVLGCAPEVTSGGRMQMELPPALRAGVQWDITDWLVFRVHSEVVFWSAYEKVRIHALAFRDENGPVVGMAETTALESPRNYRVAADVRAGFRFYPLPWWMLFAGAGYDTNAAPEETTTPDLYDAPKLGLAAGTRFQLVPLAKAILGLDLGRPDLLLLAIGVTYVHYLENTVDTSQTDPPINGSYRHHAIILNTNLEARF